MPRRQLPKIWLMTDPRFGDDLLPAIRRLPARSGVVFRHYDEGDRRMWFNEVRKICRQRGHMLLLAGPERAARNWLADGFHVRQRTGRMLHSAPVHDAREIAATRADLLFISPLHATASHMGARPLGPLRFAALARLAGSRKVIALGGMSRARAAMLDRRLVYGWAAIDAFRRA